MEKKYGDLSNKIAVITIELYDKQEYEDEQNKDMDEIMDVYKGGLD